MDKMVYIAASGAKQSLLGMALKANNLANANTTGFKADFAQARSMQAFGEGLPTRVFSMQERPGSDMTSGGIMQTGRDLDIAMSDNAWLSVQDASGNDQILVQRGFHPVMELSVFVGQIGACFGYAQDVLQVAAQLGMMVLLGGG